MNQSDVVNISAGLIEQCVRDNVCMCEHIRYGSSLDTVVGHSSLIKTSSLWISEMKAGYLRDSTAAGSVDSQPRSMEKFFNFWLDRKSRRWTSQQKRRRDNRRTFWAGEAPGASCPEVRSVPYFTFTLLLLFLHRSSWIINTYRNSVGCQLLFT